MLVVILLGAGLWIAACGVAPDDPGSTAGSGSGCVTPGSGGGGSAGGPAACTADSDCPQPVDAQCGAGTCEEGICRLDIRLGPLPSQRYGDCAFRTCDAAGKLLTLEDPSDYFDDADRCTFDFCKEGEPFNLTHENGHPCIDPEPGDAYPGVCFQGKCHDCIIGTPVADVCSKGFSCKSVFCIPDPPEQCLGKCGGVCGTCAVTYNCLVDTDCTSGNCVSGKCQPPVCPNGKKDGDETDLDCGIPGCAPCADGQGCKTHVGCASGVCKVGICQAPTCFDATKNGDEIGIDCGGPCGPC